MQPIRSPTSIEHLMRLDTVTGCTSALPGLGESVGSPLLDDRHVYWRSFPAFGDGAPAATQGRLVRLSLETWRREHLVSPDLDTSFHDFIAQDRQHLSQPSAPGVQIADDAA